jgi:hypothetical protein
LRRRPAAEDGVPPSLQIPPHTLSTPRAVSPLNNVSVGQASSLYCKESACPVPPALSVNAVLCMRLTRPVCCVRNSTSARQAALTPCLALSANWLHQAPVRSTTVSVPQEQDVALEQHICVCHWTRRIPMHALLALMASSPRSAATCRAQHVLRTKTLPRR